MEKPEAWEVLSLPDSSISKDPDEVARIRETIHQVLGGKMDEKEISQKSYNALIKYKDEYIKRLGKERYEKSVAELRDRLNTQSDGDTETNPQPNVASKPKD